MSRHRLLWYGNAFCCMLPLTERCHVDQLNRSSYNMQIVIEAFAALACADMGKVTR